MPDFKDGWEIAGEVIKPVTVQPDPPWEGSWVAIDDGAVIYLEEGKTLFWTQEEALSYLLDKVHYERKRLKRLEEKLLSQLLGEDDAGTAAS